MWIHEAEEEVGLIEEEEMDRSDDASGGSESTNQRGLHCGQTRHGHLPGVSVRVDSGAAAEHRHAVVSASVRTDPVRTDVSVRSDAGAAGAGLSGVAGVKAKPGADG